MQQDLPLIDPINIFEVLARIQHLGFVEQTFSAGLLDVLIPLHVQPKVVAYMLVIEAYNSIFWVCLVGILMMKQVKYQWHLL